MKRQNETRTRRLSGRARAFLLAVCMWPAMVLGQSRAIDAGQSSLRVHVFKTGFFSAFAHDHEIEAPIANGTIDLSTIPGVALRVDARRLRVLDPEASTGTRDEIQKTMEGPAVLDFERFPDIGFQSTRVEQRGTDHWMVQGDLTLHGQTKPVVVDVALKDGHYRGSATIKQRDFGMTPVSVAGGTVKVKDEVRIEFDIVLAQ
ncbi:MAG: YceI family protein [Candidatus Acidiferrales bacterium]